MKVYFLALNGVKNLTPLYVYDTVSYMSLKEKLNAICDNRRKELKEQLLSDDNFLIFLSELETSIEKEAEKGATRYIAHLLFLDKEMYSFAVDKKYLHNYNYGFIIDIVAGILRGPKYNLTVSSMNCDKSKDIQVLYITW